MGNRQHYSVGVTCRDLIQKVTKSLHLLQKRLTPFRFEAQWISAHQIAEGMNRQPIHAGTAFVDAAIYV